MRHFPIEKCRIFSNKSATPAAVKCVGAFEIMLVSAKIASGALAGVVTLNPLNVMAATVEANPSTLAAVGTEINGTFK